MKLVIRYISIISLEETIGRKRKAKNEGRSTKKQKKENKSEIL